MCYSRNGTIIPIYNISIISSKKSPHYIWTNIDGDNNIGHELSDEQYDALLREIEFID